MWLLRLGAIGGMTISAPADQGASREAEVLPGTEREPGLLARGLLPAQGAAAAAHSLRVWQRGCRGPHAPLQGDGGGQAQSPAGQGTILPVSWGLSAWAGWTPPYRHRDFLLAPRCFQRGAVTSYWRLFEEGRPKAPEHSGICVLCPQIPRVSPLLSLLASRCPALLSLSPKKMKGMAVDPGMEHSQRGC